MNIKVDEFDSTKKSITQVKGLLLDDPFYPYRNYNRVDRKKYTEYFCNRIVETSQTETESIALLAKVKEKITGVIAIRFAAWDSSYFGISMAKVVCLKARGSTKDTIEIKKALLGSLIQKCAEKRVQHLSIRIDLSDSTSLYVLEEMGFRVMTVEGVNILDTVKEDASRQKSSYFTVRQMEEKDFPQLVSIGKEVASILKSHYHFDLRLPRDRVQNYYIENVVNCCKGNNADKMIVVEQEGRAVGFLAYNLSPDFTKIVNSRRASIVLFALSRSQRGRGLSQPFLYELCTYTLTQADFIVGKVYLYNTGMVRLLTKFNPYPFCQYLYCLHKWL